MFYLEILIALLASVLLAFLDKATSRHLSGNDAVLSFSFSKPHEYAGAKLLQRTASDFEHY